MHHECWVIGRAQTTRVLKGQRANLLACKDGNIPLSHHTHWKRAFMGSRALVMSKMLPTHPQVESYAAKRSLQREAKAAMERDPTGTVWAIAGTKSKSKCSIGVCQVSGRK